MNTRNKIILILAGFILVGIVITVFVKNKKNIPTSPQNNITKVNIPKVDIPKDNVSVEQMTKEQADFNQKFIEEAGVK
ncbi:MAG: hypothetical protein WCK16_03425 [Candidatus Moraniibacteriota bacterium]